jgi:hypothetical protein
VTGAQRRRRLFPLLAITAVSVALDAHLAGGKGAWLILGVALGIGLVGHVSFFTPDRGRSESLLRTLAPLALPALVVAMVGTVEQPKWLQLLAGVLGIAIGWGCFVVPDTPRTKVTLAWERAEVARLARWGSLLTAVGAVPAVLLYFLLRDSIYLRDRGGFAGVLFLLAIFLWVGVAGARLVAYCTSWARIVVAALLLGALGALAFYAGLLPGDPSPATPVPTLVLAGAALVACVAAWFIDDGPQPPRGALEEKHADVAASLGLGAALLASAALAAAAVIGLVRTADPGSDRDAPKLGSLGPVTVRSYPDILDESQRALAAKYYPVLALSVHQRWAPTPVEYYLPDVTLTGPGTRIEGPTLDQLPKSCARGFDEACYTLTLTGCREGEPECAPDSDFSASGGRSVYVRVEPLKHAVNLRPPFGGTARPLTTIVQYWLFYIYDRWSQRALTGRLTQQHQGDWEVVTLGFTAGKNEPEPLFVGYSAHCAGTVLPWRDVQLASTGEARTHPLVAVAEGSQANYPKVRQAHAPDWIGCQGRPKGLLSLVGYSSNIRDITEYGRLWYPTELIPAAAGEPPMSFPGTWGENDRTELTVAETRTLDVRRGPRSPPLQGSWKNPVEAIFCKDYRGAKCMHP